MTAAAITGGWATRPGSLVAAVAVIVAGAVANLATLPLIPDDAPAAVLPVFIALSVAWLAGAWGIWQCSKLAAIFVFVITVLNGLSSVPGIFLAEDDSVAMEVTFRVGAAVGTVHAIAICWLLLMKSTRDALQ
jgi:hypothetical protein